MSIRPSSASVVLCLLLASTAACSRQQPDTRPSRPEAATVSDGYADRTKEQAGGVSSVEYNPGAQQKVARVEELLIGKFPGVEVARTDGDGYSVTIRGGAGSFMSGEQPLWVIDGVPYEVKAGRGLSWLSPDDVARIDVLKNPSETGIYGLRGANGVIVVTTKRP